MNIDARRFGEEVAQKMRAMLEPLAARLEALEKRQPEKGEKGERGEKGDTPEVDVQAAALALAGCQEIKTMIDLMVAESVEKRAAENPPEKGEKGDAGKPGAGIAGALIDRNGHLIVTLDNGEVKDLGVVVGKDGADFTTVEMDWDGERTLIIRGTGGEIRKTVPLPLDRGYWREGMGAEKGDILTHDGNAWIALRETRAKPSHEAKDDWRLFARRGRDGRDGKDGKPPPGPVKLDHD